MLQLTPLVLDKMIIDVEHDDIERCGFFFGFENRESRLVMKSMTVNNSRLGDRRFNFEISSEDYLFSERVAIREKLSLLGVYHSHINCPAIPSKFDYRAAQPYFSYIIISVTETKCNEIRSWRLDESHQFVEEKIRILKTI